MNSALFERIEDADLRVDKIVSLSLMPDYEALSDDVEEMLEDPEQLYTDGALTAPLPEDVVEADEPSEIAVWLIEQDYTGFFVRVATPIPQIWQGKATGKHHLMFSWSLCRTRWFYAGELDSALEKAVIWAEEQKQAARDQLTAANAGAAEGMQQC
jgi:hypothetical protein